MLTDIAIQCVLVALIVLWQQYLLPVSHMHLQLLAGPGLIKADATPIRVIIGGVISHGRPGIVIAVCLVAIIRIIIVICKRK